MLPRPAHGRSLLVGTAVLAIALAATGVALAVPADLVEMEVLGVIPMESESASLLVLRQKGAKTMLPIFVGRAEGTEIDGRMKHGVGERGRAPDLLRKSIEALGGKVARVVIEGTQGMPFRAHVDLQQGRSHHDLEARPSDSIALALASHAPIYATRDLMAEAGLTENEMARTHGSAKGTSREERDGAKQHAESF